MLLFVLGAIVICPIALSALEMNCLAHVVFPVFLRSLLPPKMRAFGSGRFTEDFKLLEAPERF